MTDYYSVLTKAIEALPESSGQARSDIYNRARNALIGRLRSMDPPLNEADITRQRLAMERAIRRVESEAIQVNRVESPQKAEQAPAPVKDLPEETANASLPGQAQPPSKEPVPESEPTSQVQRAEGQGVPVTEKTPSLPDRNEGDPKPEIESAAINSASAPLDDRKSVSKSEPDLIKAKPSEASGKKSVEPPPVIDPSFKQQTQEQDSSEIAAKAESKVSLKAMRARFHADSEEPVKQRASLYSFMNVLLVPLIAILLGFIIFMVYQYQDDIRRTLGIDEAFVEEGSAPKDGNLKPETVDPSSPRLSLESVLNGEGGAPQNETTDEEGTAQPGSSTETVTQDASSQDIIALLSDLPVQQAAYFEEVPNSGEANRVDGSILWKLEKTNDKDVSPYQIIGSIDLAEAGISGQLVINQSLDETAALTHTIKVVLETNDKISGGGIALINGILGKRKLNGDGEVFDAVSRQIDVPPRNKALILGLSATDQGRVFNAGLLRDFESLDIALTLANQRRVIIALERGDSGGKVVNAALNLWR